MSGCLVIIGVSHESLILHKMLVVDRKIENEEILAKDRHFNFEEFIWPHGITPPLHHVRKRRFRKRVNKRVSVLQSPLSISVKYL